jgi:predicted enzyme related to lactoylglutathione lyase
MAIELTKDSIDLGIVVTDGAKALAFYRDAVGLDHVETLDMGRGTTMERLRCGTSFVKVLTHAKTPEAANPPGGIQGGTGFRYFTISVADLEGVTKRCEDAGAKVVVSPREIRPGTSISIVEDPDGNWVEFLSAK